MKRYVFIFAWLCSSHVQAANPSNLFENGNFSQPAVEGNIPAWTTKGSVVTVDGQKALRLARPDLGMAQQVVVVPPGSKSVKMSLRVKQGDVAGAKYEADFHILGADKKSLKPDGTPLEQMGELKYALGFSVDKPAKSWKQLRFQSKLPPNAAFISVMLFAVNADGTLGNGKGSVYFTDVICEVQKK